MLLIAACKREIIQKNIDCTVCDLLQKLHEGGGISSGSQPCPGKRILRSSAFTDHRGARVATALTPRIHSHASTGYYANCTTYSSPYRGKYKVQNFLFKKKKITHV